MKKLFTNRKKISFSEFVKSKYITVYIIACVLFFILAGIFIYTLISNKINGNGENIESAKRIENPEVLDGSNIGGTMSTDYPTITSVKDGIGNVNYGSFGQGNMDYWKNPSIWVDDSLKISVVATNPKSLDLSYRYEYQIPGGSFQILKDWSSSDSLDFVVPSNALGRWLYIKVSVKDSNKKMRFDNCDDYTYLVYEVNPKDVTKKIYPVIEDSRDDKGNVNTNSWGAQEGGSWPDGMEKKLNAGDTVTFTITAKDPNNDKLEYRYQIQPQGGSFTVLKDWNVENTFTWKIPENYSGTTVYIMASVKDSDEYLLFNDSGDDYNYLIYKIK